MLILSLCAALIVAIRHPETAIGQFLRRWLIEEPARFLNDLTLAKVVGWFVFLMAIYAMAQALPMELALMGALDASALTEIMIAAGLLAANLRARTVLKWAKTAARTCARAATSPISALGRQRRAFSRAIARVRPKLKPPSADEDGGSSLAFA
jgi:hypothetical protein